MNTPQILAKAADVIEERGWYQGGYVPDRLNDRDTCPVCVIAAINVAVGYEPDADFYEEADVRGDAARELSRHLNLMDLVDEHASDPDALFDAESIVSIVGDLWNDTPGRTADEVTAALRECAAELSKETSR